MKEKINYLYDGSFEGFLTCVYYHYYEDRAAGIYPFESYQDSILFRSRQIQTDAEKAAKVYEAIENKISSYALGRVYHVFLSSLPEKDNIAFRYIMMGFRKGGSLYSLHSDPVVFAAQQAERKVSFEAHRLMGLLRFSALQVERGDTLSEMLYAKIEPDHDILELLGEHFSDRFKNEPFIIHDARREKALFSQNGTWVIAPLDTKALPDFSDEELVYRGLWKKYFESIAIEERKNAKCQKRMMPTRYWNNLTEMH
ncbi:MAG: TIGR03915 family putative DNA repair protein [Eubacteriales bacterium]|nr:TIGR03915 family putative DNA repair protein [Eubacteriales bacterium]MDD3349853.1 TIGR03915 family putative DNA repair protein [Eubacteriales bacterium]